MFGRFDLSDSRIDKLEALLFEKVYRSVGRVDDDELCVSIEQLALEPSQDFSAEAVFDEIWLRHKVDQLNKAGEVVSFQVVLEKRPSQQSSRAAIKLFLLLIHSVVVGPSCLLLCGLGLLLVSLSDVLDSVEAL